MSKSADAFRTISEVADWLGIPAHVLRFWESKFTQVKPVKRAGGRRYYRPADMQLLGGIRKLLHDEGMTIKGVQKVMRDQGVRHVAAMSPPLDDDLEEAIAGIALDVTQDEEPRGTVLSFDRPRGETAASDAALAQSAPEVSPAQADEGKAKGVATQDMQPNETTDSGAAPDQTIDAGTPDRPIDPSEAPTTSDPETDAPETPPEAPAMADVPETSHEELTPDVSAKPEAAPDPAHVEDTPPPVKPETHRPAPPAQTPPAQPTGDAPPATQEKTSVAKDSDTSAPAASDGAPAPPRVAAITVPEDPADDTAASASVLAQLAAIDPADLAAQRPALSDLAGRMAELRARMTGGAKSP